MLTSWIAVPLEEFQTVAERFQDSLYLSVWVDLLYWNCVHFHYRHKDAAEQKSHLEKTVAKPVFAATSTRQRLNATAASKCEDGGTRDADLLEQDDQPDLFDAELGGTTTAAQLLSQGANHELKQNADWIIAKLQRIIKLHWSLPSQNNNNTRNLDACSNGAVSFA